MTCQTNQNLNDTKNCKDYTSYLKVLKESKLEYPHREEYRMDQHEGSNISMSCYMSGLV